MAFNTITVMQQKIEFCQLASQGKVNFSMLCKRFEISRKTGYKWLNRFTDLGSSGLEEQSRIPKLSPKRTIKEIEMRIVDLRNQNPEWGARKIHTLLLREKHEGVFNYDIPVISTVNNILSRYGLITKEKSSKATKWQRFEYENSNELWQMDFKGYFSLENNKLCHPLTITDDHSRFNIGLFACSNQKHLTVKENLKKVFRKYGLPETILADNGTPWSTTGNNPSTGERGFSRLEMWLIKQNIRVIHGRAYHPQTQGKEERFHRTLKTELLQYKTFKNHNHCQLEFNQWRDKYNCYRPHEAIDMEVPAKRYNSSNREFSEVEKTPYYDTRDIVVKVKTRGMILFNKRNFRVGKAFIGECMAIKPTQEKYIFNVYYYNQRIRKINLQ